jgi:hypothetical protein
LIAIATPYTYQTKHAIACSNRPVRFKHTLVRAWLDHYKRCKLEQWYTAAAANDPTEGAQ